MGEDIDWLKTYIALVEEITSQYKNEELYNRVETTLKVAKTVFSQDDFSKLEEYVKEKGYLKKNH